MYEYSVTIGRNVGNEPMSELEWQAYQDDIRVLFRQTVWMAVCHCESEESFTGRGQWDGIWEDNARIVVRTTAPIDSGALSYLRTSLADTASYYGQDAIALAIGTSELIDAR